MKRDRCGAKSKSLYQVDGGARCWACVPESYWKMYPGAKEREREKHG